MNGLRAECRRAMYRLSLLLFVGICFSALHALAAQEESFPLLQIGTTTYTNVTVTTKANKYIFITHSTGMANIRVADLPADVKQSLGYVEIEKKESAKAKAVGTWARQTFGRFQTPQVMALEKEVQDRLQIKSADELKALIPAHRNLILTILASLFLLYLFSCYCLMLICRKTGHPAGPAVWLPLLQVFPVLRAAGMSPLWFLAIIIPGVNILPLVILCFRLAKARGKSPFTGFLLAFPVTSFFTFIYLAFSGGSEGRERSRGRRVPAMKFGAA